jgi:hypothetical protein
MVTIIGSVGTRGGDEHDESELRHFELQSSVYDPSKAAPERFSVVCFFASGRRWQNVRVPSSGSFVSVTAKIAGRTTKSNCLALRVLDLTYLPRSGIATTPNSTSTPATRRSNRWGNRADSSTPSKRLRTAEIGTGSVGGPAESPSGRVSPSPAPVSPTPSRQSSCSRRPKRSHRPPKKFQS